MSNDNRHQNINNAAELTEEEKGFQEKIKSLQSKVVKNEKETLCSYIEISKELLKIKIELKDRFYLAITDEVLPKKQVQRYLKLVLKIDTDKNTLVKLMKDVSQLEKQEDKRVTLLTTETINDRCKVLSMSKLMNAKDLSDYDFNKVMIDGDNKPYDDHMDKKKKDSNNESNENIKKHFEKVKDVLDEDSHKNYYEDVELAITDLAKEKKYSRELTDEVERLRKQSKILTYELQELANSTNVLHKAGVIDKPLVDMKELSAKMYIPNTEISGTKILF